MRSGALTLRAAAACGLLLASAACAQSTGAKADPSQAAASTSATARPSTSDKLAPADAVPLSDVAMAQPAALTRPAVSADLLVTGTSTLSKKKIAAVRKVAGVTDVDAFSMAQFFNEERSVTYAAVDPATFRRFTPPGSAQTNQIWKRVAGGEMAIRPGLGKKLQDSDGYVKMGNDTGAPLAHIGAYAPLVTRATGQTVIDAVVNEKWAKRLKMKRDNALLVSTGETSPQSVLKKIQAVVGKAGVSILAVNLKIGATQTAVLTGGSVSDALGTLRFTANPNGSVNPDPAWVKNYIRTETVPILGKVTCNRIMLPELRAALNDVVTAGLADKIHPGEYGGCFVPRYIAGTQSLSFHTYGTALDINVPGNERGTVGQMDRQVVAIFKKWGFGWGGDWRYTDPMHFELHRLVTAK